MRRDPSPAGAPAGVDGPSKAARCSEAAAATRSLYGGAFTDPNGVAQRIGFLDANLAMFSLWILVILAAFGLLWKVDR